MFFFCEWIRSIRLAGNRAPLLLRHLVVSLSAKRDTNGEVSKVVRTVEETIVNYHNNDAPPNAIVGSSSIERTFHYNYARVRISLNWPIRQSFHEIHFVFGKSFRCPLNWCEGEWNWWSKMAWRFILGWIFSHCKGVIPPWMRDDIRYVINWVAISGS